MDDALAVIAGLRTASSSRGRRPWRSIVDQAPPWIAALRSQ
ncbi:MAG TPA: hypothetical protein VGJ72_21145 [Polaromonas sp.]